MPNAIVFGGSTGIGRGIADAWAAAGFDTLTYNRTRPTGPGAELLGFTALDFRDPQTARTIIESTLPRNVDAVCFSSIYFTSGRAALCETTERDWLDQLHINVHGLWLALRTTLPALRRARPGVFLSVSSEVVYNAGPHRSGYASTKSAARSLVESVALEEDGDVVKIVQTLPAEMVDSPGIRARRPADFDYTDYMVGADFAPFARALVDARGVGYENDVIVVNRGGTFQSISDGLPLSQSRPLSVIG